MRVLNQMGDGVAAMVRERHPDAEVVAVTADPPPAGLTADVFFGGFGDWSTMLPWLEQTGVRWVQLSGTGADRVPAAVFEGRTVTCARGASAAPIAEFASPTSGWTTRPPTGTSRARVWRWLRTRPSA